MTALTIATPVVGKIDTGPGLPFTVDPGVYQVEQVDDGDVYLVVDEVPEVCVIVTCAALGLVECPACDGRGEYTYRVSEDEWDTDECGECEGLGGVAPIVALQMRSMMDAARYGQSS